MKALEILIEAKNVHMQHAEDLLLTDGYEGAVSALEHYEGVRKMLSKGKGDKGRVTVKWDGNPAIFTGVDPTDGKFFVGTKSVLSPKNPKYIKSPADVRKYYKEVPELGSKLLAAYKFLRNLGITGILQGDLLFTDEDKKHEKIDGEDYITFMPNTITYAVPANSELGKKIDRAKFGIVFHTTHGAEGSVRDTDMTYGVDLSSLKDDPDVWVDDATYKDYTGIASLTPGEDAHLKNEISQAARRLKALGKSNVSKILRNNEFKSNIQPFINKRVRTGEHIGPTDKFVQDFLNYYIDLKTQGMDALGAAHQKKRLEKIEDKKKFVEKNRDSIYAFLDIYNHLNEIKLILIKKLNTLDSVRTFMKVADGYKVTNPEGFVAIGHSGNAVKLVDRLEFSRQNFARREQ